LTAPSRHRPFALVTLLSALIAAALVGPAVLVPGPADNAYASTYKSCTMSRCADGRTARAGWQQENFPTSRGWYPWSGGQYNFAGGRFYNNDGQLPSGATYNEYDVYPRAKGAHRDAYRIVVNRATGATWFSPNHYADFYRLN
jgi:ribonuclease T1